MEKEFVNYNQALKLKELGFDEPCLAYWDDDKVFELNSDFLKGSQMDDTWLTAPTFSQAFRWFRDKYQLEVVVGCFYNKRLNIPYEERQYDSYVIRDGVTSKSSKYKTYEEAELACLDKLIEVVESKSK